MQEDVVGKFAWRGFLKVVGEERTLVLNECRVVSPVDKPVAALGNLLGARPSPIFSKARKVKLC
jgi:hypothetical protein